MTTRTLGPGRPEGELFFEIPENNSIIISEIVSAIPDSWRLMLGRLNAPKDLIEKGAALAETGFSTEHGFVGEHREQKNGATVITSCAPNVFAVLLWHRLPGFVSFRCQFGTIRNSKDLANGFIIKGYRGSLLFHKNDADTTDMSWCPSTDCDLQLAPWTGSRFDEKEAGLQPARIRVGFRPAYGGSENDIAPIVAACRRLGLKEYVPQPNSAEAK